MFDTVTFLLSFALLHLTYFATFLLIDFNLIVLVLGNTVFVKLSLSFWDWLYGVVWKISISELLLFDLLLVRYVKSLCFLFLYFRSWYGNSCERP